MHKLHESMFNTYQDMTRETAIYPEVGEKTLAAMTYCALGIGGEAGEVLDKLKRVHRKDREFDFTTKIEIAFELGDLLWYVARFADELGYSLHEIAQMNINKLSERKKRNVIKGSGDNRGLPASLASGPVNCNIWLGANNKKQTMRCIRCGTGPCPFYEEGTGESKL